MSVGPEIQVQFTPATQAVIERAAAAPARVLTAAARGLNNVREAVLTNIKRDRLSDKGPFPVAMHRLGQVRGTLRAEAFSTAATVQGNAAEMRIGSPRFYAGIHEFGASYTRTTKPGAVRLATKRNGTLERQAGFPSLAVFARKGRKTVREVTYAGGKTYPVNVPARHAFGFGIADNLPLLTNSVEKEVKSEWQPEGGAK